MSQQLAANHLHHAFDLAQNAPWELPLFPSSFDLTSFDRSMSQAASAYNSCNLQHVIGIQDQHKTIDIGSVPNHDAIAYPDYYTLHSQDTYDRFIPQNAPPRDQLISQPTLIQLFLTQVWVKQIQINQTHQLWVRTPRKTSIPFILKIILQHWARKGYCTGRSLIHTEEGLLSDLMCLFPQHHHSLLKGP